MWLDIILKALKGLARKKGSDHVIPLAILHLEYKYLIQLLAIEIALTFAR